MASFQDLWDKSRTFRQMFLQLRIFRSHTDYDVSVADYKWYGRYPKINWGICGVDGCDKLAIEGDCCGKHNKKEDVPKWAWSKGVLFWYTKYRVSPTTGAVTGGINDEERYVDYSKFIASKTFGPIPDGFVVGFLDENPFNLHPSNLVVLSKVAKLAVDEKVISMATAIEMDQNLEHFWGSIVKRGRPKGVWLYDYSDIAKASKKKLPHIRQAVSRGVFDPSDFSSVIDFCKNG